MEEFCDMWQITSKLQQNCQIVPWTVNQEIGLFWQWTQNGETFHSFQEEEIGKLLAKNIQYRPRALQHLHAHKLRAIWRISMKNQRKKLECTFLHQLLHAEFLQANLSVFLQSPILLIKIHASCVYFLTTANVADVKLETDIVEKRLFSVKKKTTYYTLSLTTIMLRSRTSCFVINDFLGCWLKRYFTCKLGCMLLATTVVLK